MTNSFSESEIIPGAEPFDLGSGSHGILMLHGWSSTPRDLRFLAETISHHNIRCVGPLLPGHGRDEQSLAQTNIAECFDFVEDQLNKLLKECDHVDLLGFSFGGTLSIQLAAQYPIGKLILLAPFLQIPGSPFTRFLTKGLVKILPNSLSFSKKKSGPIFDPQALQSHICSKKVAVSSANMVYNAAKISRKVLNKIKQPTLILHSIYDQTSDFQSSVFLVQKIKSVNKELIPLHRSNHVITLDYDRKLVEEKVVEFITR